MISSEKHVIGKKQQNIKAFFLKNFFFTLISDCLVEKLFRVKSIEEHFENKCLAFWELKLRTK